MRIVIASLLLGLLPAATSLAEDLPADRQPLGAPRSVAGDEGLVLPPIDASSPDAGSRSWTSVDAATIAREAHLRRVTAAYGAAGTLTGLTVTSLLISMGQPEHGVKRGWHYAAWTTGGLAAVSLITGTILWATTPPAPGQPRFALSPSGQVTLAFDFY